MIGTDYHIHTHYVGCANETMTIPVILERCKALGRASIAITDHRDKDWQVEKNRLIRQELERTDPGDIEVFFGCEVNIQDLDAGLTLDGDKKRDEGFEIVVGGVHSTWFADGEASVMQIIERQNELMCKVAADPLVDVLVHPWWFPRQQFEAQLQAGFTSMAMVPDELTCKLAETCIEHETAVELNTAAIYLYEPTSDEFKESYGAYIAGFVELGCSISLATDAHDIGKLESIKIGENVLDEMGIPEPQVWRPSVSAAVTGSALTPTQRVSQ